jgi:hypothetical protein
MQKPIAIFSSDSNPDYSEFSPLVSEMWETLGFEPFYAQIGTDQFPLIPGVESSLQSQIVRLYAAKLFPDRVVLTTDIDMLPFDQNYYWSKLPKSDNQIVIYSSDAHEGKRYPMCYLSAYGKVLSSIALENENETWEEFVLRLNSLGLGWNTDELYITERIDNCSFDKVKYNREWEYGMAKNRLDRVYWTMRDISYIDAHCPRPYSKHKEEIDQLKSLIKLNYMNIQPFIFNWNKQFDKTCAIEDSLSKIFDKVTVINSDDNNTRDGWIDLGDDAYFSDQFRKALELFDGDILMHVQGDVTYDNWEKLVEDARTYFDYYDAGIYAPNVDYSWYSSENTDIDSIQADHENIKMVACTDETVWFIRKEIIQEMTNRNVDFSNNKMGWGWDLVLSSICFVNGRPVIRDYNHTIDHPPGTNYNKDVAGKEMQEVWRTLDDELKTAFALIKGSKYDREKLAGYFQ